MANTPVIQRLLTQWGLGKETTWGTAVVPTAYLAVEKPLPKDKVQTIRDQGLRGLPALDFGVYQNERHHEMDTADTNFYPDDSGHLLMAALGFDTVTGSNPYTHTIGVATARPPSYTLYDFTGLTSGGQARQMPGCYLQELQLKWQASGKFMIATKWLGKVSAPVAKATASYSVAGIFTPLQGGLTLLGAGDQKMEDFTLTVKRMMEIIPGSGTSQDPYDILPGTVEVSGTMTFGPSDETELLDYLNNTQPSWSFLLNASASAQLTIQMTKAAFVTPTETQRSKEYDQMVVGCLGVSNATDVTTGGATSGPALFKLINARSAAY